MNWDAAHADYVLACYIIAAVIVVWCIASTWWLARKYKARSK